MMASNRELLSIAACGIIGIGYVVYQNWKSKQEGTLLDSPQVDRSDAEPATNQAQNATTYQAQNATTNQAQNATTNQAQNATTNQAQNATTNQAQNAVTSTGSDTSLLNNQIQQHNHSLGEDPNSDVETDGDIGPIRRRHPVMTPDLVEDSGQEPQPQADSNEATSPQEASGLSVSGPHDGLILCAEEDYGNANLFKQEVQEKVNVTDVDVLLYEEYALPGQSHFTTIANVFDDCRYLLIFVTHNFTQACLERFQQQMALIDSISDPEKNTRIIPVWADDKAEKLLPELSVLCGINYSGGYGSLDGNKLTNLIKFGRRQFLLA